MIIFDKKNMKMDAVPFVKEVLYLSFSSTFDDNLILAIDDCIKQIMKTRDNLEELTKHVKILIELLFLNSYEYVALHLIKLNRSGKNRLQILMSALNKQPELIILFLRIVFILCINDTALQLLSYDIDTIETILNYLSHQNVSVLIEVINLLQLIIKHSFRFRFSSNWEFHFKQRNISIQRDITVILTHQNNGQLLLRTIRLLLSLSNISVYVPEQDRRISTLTSIFDLYHLVPALTIFCARIIPAQRSNHHFLEESEFIDIVCYWLMLMNNITKSGDFLFSIYGNVNEYIKMMNVIHRILEVYQWSDASFPHIKIKQYARIIRACMNILYDFHLPGCFIPTVIDSVLMNIMFRLQIDLNSAKEETHSEEYHQLLSDMRVYCFYIVTVSKHVQLIGIIYHCKHEVREYLMDLVHLAISILPDS